MEALFLKTKSTYFPSDPKAGKLGSVDLNLALLQLFGVPLFGVAERSSCFKWFITIYGTLFLTLVRLPYLGFEVYDLMYCWRNLNEVTQNMCLSMMHLCGILKMAMVFNRLTDLDKINRLFEEMAKRYVKSERQMRIFIWNEFESKMALTMYAGFIAMSSVLGGLLLFADSSTIGNAFPYRARLPELAPTNFKVVYQPISVLFIAMQISGIDFLNVTFINLTRAQLQVLNIAFDELNQDFVGKVIVPDKLKHLHGLVEHHNLILDIRSQIESVFKFPMLVQFAASLLIFAVTGFQALVRSDASSLLMIYVYVGCILAELFLYCWYGNEVSEQNKTLASRGYDTTWYNFDMKFKKSLLMFLMNAQKPFFFTAGGYADLSLLTFSRILSKSYTYIAVLRQQYTSK